MGCAVGTESNVSKAYKTSGTTEYKGRTTLAKKFTFDYFRFLIKGVTTNLPIILYLNEATTTQEFISALSRECCYGET